MIEDIGEAWALPTARATRASTEPASGLGHSAGIANAERFYIDCEFDGHDGPLLSMALVTDNDASIHIEVDTAAMDLWVRQNVVPLMHTHRAIEAVKVYHNEVGEVIRQFIGKSENPVIVADSPVDIGRFCRALSTGSDGGWASAEYPQMHFEVHNVDCYPTDLPGAVQHNAWWDAMALRHKLAQGMEAGTATTGTGVVQDSPVAKRCALSLPLDPPTERRSHVLPVHDRTA